MKLKNTRPLSCDISHDYEITIDQSDTLPRGKPNYKFGCMSAKRAVQFSEFLPWSALP